LWVSPADGAGCALAEPGEVLEVGPVGAQCGGGFGGMNVGSGLLDEVFEVGGPRDQGKRWVCMGELPMNEWNEIGGGGRSRPTPRRTSKGRGLDRDEAMGWVGSVQG